MSFSPDVTAVLLAYGEGDEEALDTLLPLVYDQLRRLAHARLRHERSGHTLQTTGLVHEAYLKLVDIDRVQWNDRAHFFAVASRVMHRVLVDHARKRQAQKRGGGRVRVELEERFLSDAQAETLIELDDALQRLAACHHRAAQVVEYGYFGGLTNEETAEALSVSCSTVERDLRFARAWLAREWGDAKDDAKT